MDPTAIPPHRPGRAITGMSAILLPVAEIAGDGCARPAWDEFEAHVHRTAAAGLVPAVNMDTGYANLITEATRREALQRTREVLGGGRFVAGAFVGDRPGDPYRPDAYQQQIEQIGEFSGTPVIFQSHGLTSLADAELLAAYEQMGRWTPEYLAFELGQMFAPFGRIYPLAVYERLIQIPQCRGAKHSSLSRRLEWHRLAVRDRVRPEFQVLTGNDLAIDMVCYGSDYLLGLSTFAPDLFARRDRLWAASDPAFFELNDLLQYLGFLAFRKPVPAYKHNAAQFLKLRGWISTSHTWPGSPLRPDSDEPILADIWERLEHWL